MKRTRTNAVRARRGITPLGLLCLLLAVLLITSVLSFIKPYLTKKKTQELHEDGTTWYAGFASVALSYPTDETLYMAGYKTGKTPVGIADEQRVSALWLDVGGHGILLLSVDCVGLLSGTVEDIRSELTPFCVESGCGSVQVFATHTHAGIDTMGMWGPVATDGKNETFMQGLLDACLEAAQGAYADRRAGKLYAASVETDGVLEDSRYPYEYDTCIHQLRFEPDDPTQKGIRLYNFGAHAEAMRSANALVSRDFPGVLCDVITETTGDDALFIQGAVGGQIMTPEYLTSYNESGNFDAIANRDRAGQALADAALSITADDETELAPSLALSSTSVTVPLDNTLYLYYKFLGILDAKTCRCKSDTGCGIITEIGALRLGNIVLALLPGEPFPELISGDGLSDGDPTPLSQIAAGCGYDTLWACGLSNDAIGYWVTPSTFALDEDLPYITHADTEDGNIYHHHYEETNSVGDDVATVMAQAFAEVMEKLQ